MSRGNITRAAVVFAGTALLAPACGDAETTGDEETEEYTSGGEGETTVEILE